MARNDAVLKAAASMQQPNMLLLFSTAPGGVALDGPPGENSPFAAALLRQLGGSSVDLLALPARTRRDLLLETECRQPVWDQSTYSASFALSGPGMGTVGPRPDPARIVELPKAYAFAQENGLLLPQGLVALRPIPGPLDAQKYKVGSFHYTHMAPNGGGIRTPVILIVLAIPDAGSIEMVQSEKNFVRDAGGTRWRNITAENRKNGLVWLTILKEGRNEVEWRDHDSGTVASGPANTNPNSGRIMIWTFARLDG